jgi:hypothetical protein
MKKEQRKRVGSSKPKKVTIKFFLNQAVQPMVERKTKRYPLYALITYDRKNTMMRCHYGQYYKDLSEVDKVHYPGLLAMEERIIRKTIDYEMAQRSDEFDLKGIYKKYDQYCIGIHGLLAEYLKGQLWNILMRLEPFEFAKALNFNDPDIEFETLYKMSKRLYKDFVSFLPKHFDHEMEVYQLFNKLYRGSFFQYAFPTMIEWLDNSAANDLREKMKEHYSQTPSMVNKSIDFVDRIVRGQLEQNDTSLYGSDTTIRIG